MSGWWASGIGFGGLDVDLTEVKLSRREVQVQGEWPATWRWEVGSQRDWGVAMTDTKAYYLLRFWVCLGLEGKQVGR
jgi:hypothetical protein